MLSTCQHFLWAFKTDWSIDKQRFRARGISRARGRATQVWRVRGMRWSGKRPAYLVWLSKRWGWLRWRWQRGEVGSGALDRNQGWLLVCETEMWLGGVAINGVRDSWKKGREKGRGGQLAWLGVSWQAQTAPPDSLQLFQFLCYSTIGWTLSYFQQKSPCDHIGLTSTSFILWQIGTERKFLSNFPNFNSLFLSMLWVLMGFLLIFRKSLPML